jgi:hypothetical protein
MSWSYDYDDFKRECGADNDKDIRSSDKHPGGLDEYELHKFSNRSDIDIVKFINGDGGGR